MKYSNQQVLLESKIDTDVIERLEKIARTCYDSKNLIKEGSGLKLIEKILKNGHLSILEHYSVSFRIISSRSIIDQICRHRTGKYAVRSTRYVNMIKDELPIIMDDIVKKDNDLLIHFLNIEELYPKLIKKYGKEIARMILPLSVESEAIVTMDLRNLKHFLELRCAKNASPMIQDIAFQMLTILYTNIPLIFDDLYVKYIEHK